MKTVSVLDFRKNTQKILTLVQSGHRMVLTLRGKPVMRLEPIEDGTLDSTDPFYRLGEKAVKAGASRSNRQMDKLIYGA